MPDQYQSSGSASVPPLGLRIVIRSDYDSQGAHLQPKLSDMPVGRVRGGRGAHGRMHQLKGIRTVGLIQSDGLRAEINVIRKVVPLIRHELGRPLIVIKS